MLLFSICALIATVCSACFKQTPVFGIATTSLVSDLTQLQSSIYNPTFVAKKIVVCGSATSFQGVQLILANQLNKELAMGQIGAIKSCANWTLTNSQSYFQTLFLAYDENGPTFLSAATSDGLIYKIGTKISTDRNTTHYFSDTIPLVGLQGYQNNITMTIKALGFVKYECVAIVADSTSITAANQLLPVNWTNNGLINVQPVVVSASANLPTTSALSGIFFSIFFSGIATGIVTCGCNLLLCGRFRSKIQRRLSRPKTRNVYEITDAEHHRPSNLQTNNLSESIEDSEQKNSNFKLKPRESQPSHESGYEEPDLPVAVIERRMTADYQRKINYQAASQDPDSQRKDPKSVQSLNEIKMLKSNPINRRKTHQPTKNIQLQDILEQNDDTSEIAAKANQKYDQLAEETEGREDNEAEKIVRLKWTPALTEDRVMAQHSEVDISGQVVSDKHTPVLKKIARRKTVQPRRNGLEDDNESAIQPVENSSEQAQIEYIEYSEEEY